MKTVSDPSPSSSPSLSGDYGKTNKRLRTDSQSELCSGILHSDSSDEDYSNGTSWLTYESESEEESVQPKYTSLVCQSKSSPQLTSSEDLSEKYPQVDEPGEPIFANLMNFSRDGSLKPPPLQVKMRETSAKYPPCQKRSSHEDLEQQNANEKIAKILDDMQQISQANGDQWRTLAYRRAAAAVRHTKKQILNVEDAKKIPGIGPRIAEKVLLSSL